MASADIFMTFQQSGADPDWVDPVRPSRKETGADPTLKKIRIHLQNPVFEFDLKQGPCRYFFVWNDLYCLKSQYFFWKILSHPPYSAPPVLCMVTFYSRLKLAVVGSINLEQMIKWQKVMEIDHCIILNHSYISYCHQKEGSSDFCYKYIFKAN